MEIGNKNISKVWDKVLVARSANRINGENILHNVFDSFYELHGDRLYGDDKSIISGLALLDNYPVSVIVQNKKNTSETHYGMPFPEGYRKTLRIMEQANKFGRPIINVIDTPGAYPGIEAEKRGQAEAIARNLYAMANMSVPIISIIIGEGGSGGALALSLANKIYMLENAIFSVVSPEGCASILWKSKEKAPLAAYYLKLTAIDLFKLGIIDGIIDESKDLENVYRKIKTLIKKNLLEYENMEKKLIQEDRRNKYRKIGQIVMEEN